MNVSGFPYNHVCFLRFAAVHLMRSEWPFPARRVGEAIHAAPCSQAPFGLRSPGPLLRRVPGPYALAAVSLAAQASLSETLSISRPCSRGCTSSISISLSPIIHFPDRDTRGIISAPTVPPRSAGQKTLGPRDHFDRKRAACLAGLLDRSHPHGGVSKRAVRVSSRRLPALSPVNKLYARSQRPQNAARGPGMRPGPRNFFWFRMRLQSAGERLLIKSSRFRPEHSAASWRSIGSRSSSRSSSCARSP